MSLIKVNSDMYNICSRIQDIDRYYYVVFNTKTKTYELHHSRQKYNSFCLNLGQNLTPKCLAKINRTKRSEFKKILDDLELHNTLVRSKAYELMVDKASCKIKQYISYLDHSTKSVDFNRID